MCSSDLALSPVRTLELPIEIPNDQLAAALGGEARFPLELEMRRGPQRLAVGLRDLLGRVDSTLHLDLDVGHQQPSVADSL